MKFQDNILTTKMCPAMRYCDVIRNQRWRTAAILKIAKSPYLSEKSSDFDKIWTLQQILNPMTVTWPKIKVFKIQDGGSAILKIAFLGQTHRSIVRLQRNFVRGSRIACRQGLRNKNCKFLKSKMADGRHFQKSIYCHILVNKNLAIANRSRISCAHKTLRASTCLNITPWPWNLN